MAFRRRDEDECLLVGGEEGEQGQNVERLGVGFEWRLVWEGFVPDCVAVAVLVDDVFVRIRL
jgi:hypothetical protein